jgi:hypothetical protein
VSAPQAVFRPPAEPAPARAARRVYLIAAPGARTGPGWPRIRAELTVRVRGAELAAFGDLFTGSEDYRDRWPKVVRDQLAGAVVIPSEEGGRQLIGRLAFREIDSIGQAGKPVLVNVRAGLIPWGQVQVRKIRGPGWAGAELIIPGVTS